MTGHALRVFAPGPAIAQADFGLMVDVDVPYFPRDTRRERSNLLGADRRRCGQGRLADVELPKQLASAGATARAFSHNYWRPFQRKASSVFRQAAAATPVAQMAADKIKRDARGRGACAGSGASPALSMRTISAPNSAKRIAPEDVICAEAARNSPAVTQQIPRPVAGTPRACRGRRARLLGAAWRWACGWRVPTRLAIQIVGDGSFYFNVTEFGLRRVQTTQPADLPRSSSTNGGWSAVKESTLAGLSGRRRQGGRFIRSRTAGRCRLLQDSAKPSGAYGEEAHRPETKCRPRSSAASKRCAAAVTAVVACVCYTVMSARPMRSSV